MIDVQHCATVVSSFVLAASLGVALGLAIIDLGLGGLLMARALKGML